VGIGNIFPIIQNMGDYLISISTYWKYISKTCTTLRSVDKTPLFKTYPNIQKKIFGKILGIWYVCKN
jgi:hypothetical protein